jgi:hypothetical protein
MIAMPAHSHPNAMLDIPMPGLSDEAVVQIHDFIAHFPERFEARYGDQIHRFYEDRPAHNLIEQGAQPYIDDPPF